MIKKNNENCRNLIIALLNIFLILIIADFVAAQESPHNVEGYVFNNNSGTGAGNLPVRINNTITRDTVLTYTQAEPPFAPFLGKYSATIGGNDGDLINITSWNATHWGFNATTLAATTTFANVTLNITRGSETNVTIMEPLNNTLKNVTNIFNVTANVTILGNNGVNCNATISFSNNRALNITQDQNFTNLLGNMALGTSKLTTWNVTAISEGTSDITVYAQCFSDDKILEGLNHYTIFIKINDTAPIVNTSLNNTAPKYGEVINFTANVSDEIGLSFCQFIDNQSNNGAKRYYNKTLSGFSDQCSQDFIISKDGGVINFTLVVNNTADFKKQKEFIITVVGIPPRWQNPEINDSNVEQFDFVRFNATWTDNVNLSAYIFSINATGIWPNVSNFSFSGTANESNFTMQINASPNTVVGWTFYANDSFNNFNATDVQIFVVASQYHIFYGNISAEIVLDTSQNLSILAWFDSINVKGNVYVTDADTLNGISWTSLQAIGKDKLLNDVIDDWEDIDVLISMTQLNDSINRTFINGTRGIPINKTDFLVQGSLIVNVSTINSTNSSSFVTGILWDTSDSADAQYDTAEKEDLVFITKVDNKALGSFGTYNYEAKVPAKLQGYRQPNNQDSLSFYAELT